MASQPSSAGDWAAIEVVPRENSGPVGPIFAQREVWVLSRAMSVKTQSGGLALLIPLSDAFDAAGG
jgi:hypothetical protein